MPDLTITISESAQQVLKNWEQQVYALYSECPKATTRQELDDVRGKAHDASLSFLQVILRRLQGSEHDGETLFINKDSDNLLFWHYPKSGLHGGILFDGKRFSTHT